MGTRTAACGATAVPGLMGGTVAHHLSLPFLIPAQAPRDPGAMPSASGTPVCFLLGSLQPQAAQGGSGGILSAVPPVQSFLSHSGNTEDAGWVGGREDCGAQAGGAWAW